MLQLLEFLRVALTHEQYAAMLPEPQVIMQDFFLDATTALTLHRPLLSHIQPPAVAANDEEDGEIDAPKDTDMDASAAGESFSVIWGYFERDRCRLVTVMPAMTLV